MSSKSGGTVREAADQGDRRVSSRSEVVRFYATIPLLVALILIFSAELGFLRVPNGLLFDAATGQLPPREPRVIVVQPAAASRNTDWAATAQRLRALGADKVVFTFDPFGGRATPAVGRDIIVARTPRRIPGSSVQWAVPGAGDPGASIGAKFIPEGDHGVFRSQRLWLPGAQGRLPTIEALATDRSLSGRGPFLIAMPVRESLPRLTVEQLASPALPPGLLAGKIAVVGPGRDADPPRFATPASTSTSQVSSTEFHARAIQSLLTGRTVQTLPGLWRAILLIAACLLLVRLFVRFDPRDLIRNFALTLLATLVIAYGLLAVAGIMLPLAELLLAEFILGFLIYRYKETLSDERLTRLVDRATAYVARHNLLTDLGRWPDFLATAARLAGIDRSLLIEQTDDGRYQHLSGDTAGDDGSIVALPASSLFKQADVKRPQTVDAAELMPEWTGEVRMLRVTGEQSTPAYWLYAIPADVPHRDRILRAVQRLSQRLVDALDLEQGDRTPLRRSRRFKSLDDQVAHSMQLIVSRSGELRQSLASMQTAMILYDPVGMPLQTNHSMVRLFAKLGLAVDEATPVDVVEALTATDCDAARFMLRELVLSGGELRMSGDKELDGRRYLLRVTQVLHLSGEATGGLLFEAIDVTEMERLAQVQRELANQIDSQIRNDLEAIQLATRLATDKRLPPERQKIAFDRVAEATARARGTLGSIGQLLDEALAVGAPDPYPINPKSALIRAVATVRSSADALGVRLDLEQPELATAIIAEPGLLDDTVEAMINIALSDSPRGSAIAAVLVEQARHSEITITGGFGLPSETFEELLAGSGDGAPGDFRTLARALEVIPAWGGQIDATSKPSAGYAFRLKLKKV